MAETPSTMINLGTPIPSFSLKDCHGNEWTKCSHARGTLVIFMCNHCPFVVHIASVLPKIHEACTEASIQMVGINSNDVENYPADSPENMVTTATENNWTFPYLFDADQSVAKAFDAACTPDVFLYDHSGNLFYRGQIDDSRPNSGDNSDGKDLLEAIECIKTSSPIPENQKPAIGCNIKWKP